MVDDDRYSKAVNDLRGILPKFVPGHQVYDEIVGTKDEVFARYQPIFTSEHVPNLTKEEFTSFLYFENNHHWSGLYRRGLNAAEDIDGLREALAALLDENKPIHERFPEAINKVSGLGKAIASGILTVAYPDRYGVWNNTSEAALRQLGIWPDFDRGDGVGRRYQKINDILLRLSSDLGIDLWTLDALWWFVLEEEKVPKQEPGPSGTLPDRGNGFALERQLEAFLLENWERTPLAQEWSIYSTQEDPEVGNQYPTDVGRIDILAQHRTEPKLLVVELKRNQSTDQTVGQVLRYMGWVQKHLAQNGQSVEALIIAHRTVKEVQYAVLPLANVRLMTYEVEFRLNEVSGL